MSVFKAYDIRGPYGPELNEDLAYRIGRCLPGLLDGRRALVGHDARLTSEGLCQALSKGLSDAGCDVDVMGLASTPMVYFFTAKKNYDFSIQITASHNPAGDNGFKISGRGARPVGYDTGLAKLEAAVAQPLPAQPVAPGKITKVSLRDEFIDFLRPWLEDISNLKLAVDCSDGMGSLTARSLLGETPVYVACTPDGRFPHHPPNPLEEAGRVLLTETVRKTCADAGLIFDGDADRVMFVDENGDFVRPDLMIAPMASYFLRRHPGSAILQDIRTSRGVTEYLENAGAKPAKWKVGHAFAKVKMRELNAVFGGELAGHYYFRDFFWCDSGELAAIIALNEIAAAKRAGLKFSDMMAPVAKYPNTGELNYRINDKDAAIDALKSSITCKAAPEAVLDFDGYRIEYRDWWISMRKSNTEPYLRLILEAENKDILDARLEDAERVLKSFT